ncbi:hypothetical protein V1478_012498 [Vespula squamosa]|uniref:Uncharacterized protein n=1 Tax=Vespula squamosa TaxID=30214 RepID=A0ABD2ADC9_VESSQ
MESLPPTLVLDLAEIIKQPLLVEKVIVERRPRDEIQHGEFSAKTLTQFPSACLTQEKNLSFELPQASSLSVILPLVSAILSDDVSKS